VAVAISRNGTDPAGVASSGGVSTYNNGGSGFSIGAAAINKVVALCITKEVATQTVSSVTIDYGAGDVAMTVAPPTGGVGHTFGSVGSWIYYLRLPPNTSATTAIFKVTWTGAVGATENHVTIYTLSPAASSPSFSGTFGSTDMDSGTPLTTGSTTIASGAAMFAVAACATDTTAAKTWSQLTEDLEVDAGAYTHTTATSTTAGTQTRTCTGSNNAEDGLLAWAHFAEDTAQPITASLVASDDVFRTAQLNLELTGGLFTDTDVFQTATVESAGAGQDITGSLFSDGDVFQTHDVVELDDFFSATLSFGLTGGLYTDTDVFFTANVGAQTIDGALYTDTDTFFGATLTQAQVISGSLFSDGDVFETHDVVELDDFFGSVISFGLTGGLYTDTDTFFTATVEVADDGQEITGSLFSDTDTFFTHDVVDIDVFYSATATYLFDATGDHYDEGDTFYQSQVGDNSQTITGSLFSDGDVFQTADVIELDTFYGATLTATYAITGAHYADTDVFQGAILDQTGDAQAISGALYTDTDAFQTATVTTGEVTITGSLYSDADAFFTASVDASAQVITGSLYVDDDTFFDNFVGNTLRVFATLHEDTDTFYEATVSGGVGAARGWDTSDPGFWTEEHRKIKEREERRLEEVPEPITTIELSDGSVLEFDEDLDIAEIQEMLEMLSVVEHVR
jgi:hypothetical protein